MTHPRMPGTAITFGVMVWIGLWLIPTTSGLAQTQEQARELTDISYYAAEKIAEPQTEYQQERCRLDLYLPPGEGRFPTVVWFHGGGLKAGQKSIPTALQGKGVAVVAPNYRLSPQVKAATCIADAAAAVAWTFREIEKYGGDARQIFVSGHSAGGYLTLMVGCDRRWLAAHDIDHRRIAGLIPYSGHTITHFTIRGERGISGKQPIIDEFAPLFYVTEPSPPICLITGDRDLELLGRYEENAYFWRMLRVAGRDDVELFELEGFDHGGMAEPAHPLLLNWISRATKSE